MPIADVRSSNNALVAENYSPCSTYLIDTARARAELDAGVQGVAFRCIDELVHFVFEYVLFVFYPAYDRFYYEMQVEAFGRVGREVPAYESSKFREAVLFIHRFICAPDSVGSIFPSSSALVEAITKKVSEAANRQEPQRYLEIGPGTGSFTDSIISNLRENDHLDLVEYDADLCTLLRRRYHHLSNVTVHHISIFDYNAPSYDVVVSGLPLMNFSPDFVREAHNKYVGLTKPGGSFSYFEYLALPSIKHAFLCGEAAAEFEQILGLKAELERNYADETDDVWWNMTPARVVHCKTPIPAGPQ